MGCAERKGAEVPIWGREVCVVRRLEDARELLHKIRVGGKMVVVRCAGNWLEVKGSK